MKILQGIALLLIAAGGIYVVGDFGNGLASPGVILIVCGLALLASSPYYQKMATSKSLKTTVSSQQRLYTRLSLLCLAITALLILLALGSISVFEDPYLTIFAVLFFALGSLIFGMLSTKK